MRGSCYTEAGQIKPRLVSNKIVQFMKDYPEKHSWGADFNPRDAVNCRAFAEKVSGVQRLEILPGVSKKWEVKGNHEQFESF